MGEGESHKPSYSPPVRIRLLWWFGIFFAAQLPLIPCIFAWGWGNRLSICFLFPEGMAWWLVILTAWLLKPMNVVPGAVDEYVNIALMGLPWVIYAFHLFFSLRVQSRRCFLILLWSLGVIVLFNLGSCADFLRDPPQ